ncbi:helix-turn-helix domain-containing protein [Streptomyces abikoensis]
MPVRTRLDPSQGLVEAFGALIRTLRDAKGWSLARLYKESKISIAALSSYERGKKVPSKEFVEVLDRVLGADGALIDARDRLEESPEAQWVSKYFNHETQAVRLRHLTDFVPALLQTDGYLTALLESGMSTYGGCLEEKVRYRRKRKELLERPKPPQFSTVIKEPALHWEIATPHVMREQLLYLLDAADRPHVDIRVMPYGTHWRHGSAMSLGHLTIWTYREGRSVAYRPSPTRGLYITQPGEVAAYTAMYDHLQADALSQDASKVLIRKVVEEKYPCAPHAPICP